MKTETTREIAEQIVRAYYPDDDELLESILAALKDRDERAAKIAETRCTEWGQLSEQYWREGDKENARIRHGWSCGAAAIVKEIRGTNAD